jgi:tRNA (uracil-5-)-methyltransferase
MAMTMARRAGLDPATEELLAAFDRIVYISCNPTTLHANLAGLSASHRITRFALFDQFPFTEHVECGVYLERRQDG